MGEQYGIRLLGLGAEQLDPPEWVVAYDPDAGDPDVPYPTGELVSDVDPSSALAFNDRAQAIEFWRQTSTRTPRRPDGMPNRPLTAYTVEITAIPEKVG